jgi:hypothetical protein
MLKGADMKAISIKDKVSQRIQNIIEEHAWVDGKGHSAIQQENYENLEISLTEYIVPLLDKAGYFVDQDDGMLTRVNKMNPQEIAEKYVDKVRLQNQQLVNRFSSDKLRIAIATLRLLETSDRLTPVAVKEIALKALDDMASIGNPGLVGQNECLSAERS